MPERCAKRNSVTRQRSKERRNLHGRRRADAARGGRDAASYEAGLRSAIHADVDIVSIGGLRSLEAVQLVLTLAETGHTVLAVMGVGSVAEAVQRLCDVFGPQGDTIRRLLAQTLLGAVTP